MREIAKDSLMEGVSDQFLVISKENALLYTVALVIFQTVICVWLFVPKSKKAVAYNKTSDQKKFAEICTHINKEKCINISTIELAWEVAQGLKPEQISQVAENDLGINANIFKINFLLTDVVRKGFHEEFDHQKLYEISSLSKNIPADYLTLSLANTIYQHHEQRHKLNNQTIAKTNKLRELFRDTIGKLKTESYVDNTTFEIIMSCSTELPQTDVTKILEDNNTNWHSLHALTNPQDHSVAFKRLYTRCNNRSQSSIRLKSDRLFSSHHHHRAPSKSPTRDGGTSSGENSPVRNKHPTLPFTSIADMTIADNSNTSVDVTTLNNTNTNATAATVSPVKSLAMKLLNTDSDVDLQQSTTSNQFDSLHTPPYKPSTNYKEVVDSSTISDNNNSSSSGGTCSNEQPNSTSLAAMKLRPSLKTLLAANSQVDTSSSANNNNNKALSFDVTDKQGTTSSKKDGGIVLTAKTSFIYHPPVISKELEQLLVQLNECCNRLVKLHIITNSFKNNFNIINTTAGDDEEEEEEEEYYSDDEDLQFTDQDISNMISDVKRYSGF